MIAPNHRTQLIDLELSQPLQPLTALAGYGQVRAVVRWHGVPLGEVGLPVRGGECPLSSQLLGIFPQLNPALCRLALRNRLLQAPLPTDHTSWRMDQLLTLPPAPRSIALPHVSIAFIVRDPTHITAITASLVALQALAPPPSEVFVIETVPANDCLQALVQSQFPQYQYRHTAIPSYNAARNLAIAQAQGEIIAFTDERGRVNPQWATTFAHTFAAHDNVMAVTGWVLPTTIEPDRQARVERGYSLSRGATPQWHRWAKPPSWMQLGTMQLGSSLNMAFRRSVFDRVGQFDLALDVPGATWGGGELDMWSRLLLAGETLLYEPAALVRWHIPPTAVAIRTTLRQEILGFYAYLAAGRLRFPHLTTQWRILGIWKLTRLCLSLVRAYGIPRAWIAAELKGAGQSLGRYRQGLAQVAAMPPTPVAIAPINLPKSKAVRLVDITQPLPDFADITDYTGVQVYVRAGDQLLGQLTIANNGTPVSQQRLATAIADQLTWEVLALPYGGDRPVAQAQAEQAIRDHWMPDSHVLEIPPSQSQLPLSVPVSIIITTCDRPDDLNRCLYYLTQQQTTRPIEIIVADNRPQSGLTQPVVDAYAGVCYVSEARAGSSYGRNAAIGVSHGDIIVTIDDDVVVPSDWLEKLLAPLVRPEVAIVTGSLLPLELETEAQHIFENLKGGLSQGWQSFEVDQAWIDSYHYSPPTWNLGVSANAAFRSSIFAEPRIGLMDEVLGAGTPCGGGEENYLFYKVLRAGHTLVYQPNAYAWHKHRHTMPALCRQWHGYMRSATSYHLTLWLQEKDRRGFNHLVFGLPIYLWGYVIDRLRGQHQVPWSVVRSEVSGFFYGFWGYARSVLRVKRLGRSQPYVPPAQRTTQVESPDPVLNPLPINTPSRS